MALTQSIKKTWKFGKTWTTGDSVYVKMKMAMLGDSKFWRVYKDGALLTYTTNWTFNNTKGYKIGAVDGLVDGIALVSPVNNSVYTVEYDEYLMPFSPSIVIYRSDGVKPNRSLPSNTIVGEGSTGRISSISWPDENDLLFTVGYDSDSFTKTYRYADRLFCPEFDFNKSFPTGWRLEIYKLGRNWSGRRASAPASELTTMDSVLSPRATYTTNAVNISFMKDRKRTGEFKIRMRNTNTNEVSQFSHQTVRSRVYHYLNSSFSGVIGRILRVSLA